MKALSAENEVITIWLPLLSPSKGGVNKGKGRS